MLFVYIICDTLSYCVADNHWLMLVLGKCISKWYWFCDVHTRSNNDMADKNHTDVVTYTQWSRCGMPEQVKPE